MDTKKIISEIEAEWDLDDGFLGILRQGEFRENKFEHLMDLLKSITIEDELLINRRLVSLIWYIPLFMTWQQDYFIANNKDARNVIVATNTVVNTIEDILGVP
jgi:hypothetical protein